MKIIASLLGINIKNLLKKLIQLAFTFGASRLEGEVFERIHRLSANGRLNLVTELRALADDLALNDDSRASRRVVDLLASIS